MPDDGSNGAPVARQPLEETSNEEVSCCFCGKHAAICEAADGQPRSNPSEKLGSD
jgi:hypothetical protein